VPIWIDSVGIRGGSTVQKVVWLKVSGWTNEGSKALSIEAQIAKGEGSEEGASAFDFLGVNPCPPPIKFCKAICKYVHFGALQQSFGSLKSSVYMKF
jgi:hypothetical protein